MNKQGKSKFSFGMLLLYFVFNIVTLIILITLASNPSNSDCIIKQDNICINTLVISVWIILALISSFILYKVYPPLFWIWLAIQVIGLFTGFGGILKSVSLGLTGQ